jgi:predicted N-formylglutamate amidohydrolase
VIFLPEHDRLLLVLDGDEAGHPVFCVSVHSFSGIAEDFTSLGRQADLHVSFIYS